MRILGVDPGYAIVGYGVVDYNMSRFTTIGYGAITTPAGMPFGDRLKCIYEDMQTIISRYCPEQMSVERLYFNTNTTTAIEVAEARGVILLAAQLAGLSVAEYTPLQVKQSVTGYGKAEKRQIMELVRNLLGLKNVPRPDDAADALALAVCHAHSVGTPLGKMYSEVLRK